MGGYHYWKGGDDDPRDQVGVNPTTPAAADAEPVHPVWGYPFPTAGPPDLQHAIQAAEQALRQVQPHWHWRDVARIAVEAAAPVLLQATRDRLADLQKRHNDLAATIREWHLECIRLERERDEAEARLAAALDGPAAQEDGG